MASSHAAIAASQRISRLCDGEADKGLLLHPEVKRPRSIFGRSLTFLSKDGQEVGRQGEFADALTRTVSRLAGAYWMGKAWKKRSGMSAF